MARLHLDGLGAHAVQQPFHKALLTGKTTNAAWRSKPSYYAVSTEDRTINPDLERFMAKRIEHLCLRFRQVARKITQESLLGKPRSQPTCRLNCRATSIWL